MTAEGYDRASPTSRRQAAVEFMINNGWTWDGKQWIKQPHPQDATGRYLDALFVDDNPQTATGRDLDALFGKMMREDLDDHSFRHMYESMLKVRT